MFGYGHEVFGLRTGDVGLERSVWYVDIRPGGSVTRQRQLVSEVCALCVVCCVSVRVEFCAVWLLLPRADRGRRGERCGSCYREPEYLSTALLLINGARQTPVALSTIPWYSPQSEASDGQEPAA